MTTTETKTPVIYSMEAITVQIFLRSDGDYDYQVWPCDLETAAERSEEGSDEGADNGGVCTGGMGDAVGMAAEAALAVVRNHFSDNAFNNEVCPSSLDENGEPNVIQPDGETETAHKYGEPFKNHAGEQVRECDECGAIDELDA